MGYYIRVLGIRDIDIHIDEVIKTLKEEGLNARFLYEENEDANKWTILQVTNDKGEPLSQIERNPVVDGELGKEELEEFKEEVRDYKPEAAAEWLLKYFDKVKVIYAFQMLNAAFEDANYEIVASLRAKIWNITGGILQANNEGFSNEDGYHILWQFSDNVTGEWSCAVRNSLGKWERFTMDLGNKIQRQEFMNGDVPKHSIRL